MRGTVWAILIGLAATVSGGGNAVAGRGATPPQASAQAIAYVLASLQERSIVAVGEGAHAAREPHELLRDILSDERVLRAIDVVIVEFATALHQSVLDAYIRGDPVPFEELSRVWRDTSTSPVAPWDSPLYHELLRAIRDANAALRPEDRVRVLAGDPPVDWAAIESREDFERWAQPRDPYVAKAAIEQAFGLGKKVLVVYGGAHLPKVPLGDEDDLRNSLTYRILREHPGSVRVLEFLDPENLGVADRIDELEVGAVYATGDHWVGGLDAERFFPGILSRVMDPVTGEITWQELPLYAEYRIRDLFDGLVYVGLPSEWHAVPASLDEERDGAYLRELERRRLIRFGR